MNIPMLWQPKEKGCHALKDVACASLSV